MTWCVIMVQQNPRPLKVWALSFNLRQQLNRFNDCGILVSCDCSFRWNKVIKDYTLYITKYYGHDFAGWNWKSMLLSVKAKKGCFHTEFCCLLPGSKMCIHVSSHVTTRFRKVSPSSLYCLQYSLHILTLTSICSGSSKRGTHLAETRRIPRLLDIISWAVPYEIPKCSATFSTVTLLSSRMYFWISATFLSFETVTGLP